MKLVRFRDRRGREVDIASRITQVQTLLTDLRGRQFTAREDRQRLQASLERLGVLMHEVARGTETLRRSARRLRGVHPEIGPPPQSP